MEFEYGFYTALGTPLDETGHVLANSLAAEVERMIAAKSAGLLVLGSMGMQPAVSPKECASAAQIAARAAAGRAPLFVGVMDNSVKAVCERIDALKGLAVDGVVLTPPFYFGADAPALRTFFRAVADFSPFPVFLYDLPVATKIKLTCGLVAELQRHPNIRGIKTADLTMILALCQDAAVKPDFDAFYSGLDTVDVGARHGVRRYLDGMFSCTPRNAREMESCFAAGDAAGGAAALKRILSLRDLMASFGIFPSYTAIMNLLGMPGRFAPDYEGAATAEQREALRLKIREMQEL